MNNHSLIDIIKNDKCIEIINTLDNNGILNNIFPELTALKSNGEKGHKDNYIHTLYVLQNCIELNYDITYRLAALMHDLGKSRTKKYSNNFGWSFHNHESVGASMLRMIWDRLLLPEDMYSLVFKITKNHGHVTVLTNSDVTDSAIRRFITEVGSDWEIILKFSKADITTKYEDKKFKFRKEVDELHDKIIKFLLEEEKSKWKSPIDGIFIMERYKVTQGRILGDIKNDLIDAIKSKLIEDTKESAINYLDSKYQIY